MVDCIVKVRSHKNFIGAELFAIHFDCEVVVGCLMFFLFNIRFLNFSIVFPCFLPIGFNHFSMGWEILSFEKPPGGSSRRAESVRVPETVCLGVGDSPLRQQTNGRLVSELGDSLKFLVKHLLSIEVFGIESSIYRYTHIMSRKSILDAR